MLCARLIAQVTQIQSLLDVTLLLDCLNLWRMKVLWFRVQVWRDLPSSHVIPVCLLPVFIIMSGTWLRWKKTSSQVLQSPSCLVGYLKPHSHFGPSCTHFTQQKFSTDGVMGIWSLRSLCWWGDSGKYEVPVTACADRRTFEYLSLSRVRLPPPVAMPTREVCWVSISLPCPSSPFPCVQRYDHLRSDVGPGEKMEMQLLGAQLGTTLAELPLLGCVVVEQLKALPQRLLPWKCCH